MPDKLRLMIRQRARQFSLLPCLVAVTVFGISLPGCGGDDDEPEGPSPESLEGLLPPASQLGPLNLQATLTWDNAIDLVVQGVVLPEATAPSDAVAQIEDAGFVAGAGEILMPRGDGSPVNATVAAFDSTEGVAQAQEYLHTQDLEQPCAAACAVSPVELPIKDIPDATAVHHVPVEGELPPGVHPFEGFAIEFPIGENLFYASASAGPGEIPVSTFERGAANFYRYAKQHSQ